jgi:hypothetical protein
VRNAARFSGLRAPARIDEREARSSRKLAGPTAIACTQSPAAGPRAPVDEVALELGFGRRRERASVRCARRRQRGEQRARLGTAIDSHPATVGQRIGALGADIAVRARSSAQASPIRRHTGALGARWQHASASAIKSEKSIFNQAILLLLGFFVLLLGAVARAITASSEA